MSRTVISNNGTIDYAGGSDLTVDSNMNVTGDMTVAGMATFSGGISGIPTPPAVVAELDDPTIDASETYNCGNNVRVIRYNGAPGGNWSVAALTNLSLAVDQATTVKVLFPAPGADRTVTISGMTVDGTAATQVNPTTVKAKKDKCVGVALEVIKNSAGNFYVYGSALVNE